MMKSGWSPMRRGEETRGQGGQLKTEVTDQVCALQVLSNITAQIFVLVPFFSQTSSLYLSAALLRAILMNHIAQSEANDATKVTEVILKSKIDDMEIREPETEA
jgi:hypothetical protein